MFSQKTVILSLLGFTLAFPSFAAPTNEECKKISAVLNANTRDVEVEERKVLEALSTEVGKQILKLALEIEVSNAAVAHYALPTKVTSGIHELKTTADKAACGGIFVTAGSSVAIGAEFTRSLTLRGHIRALQTTPAHAAKIFRRCTSLGLVVSLGAGLSLGGTSVNALKKQVTELNEPIEQFISDAALSSFAHYWSSILSSDDHERRALELTLGDALDAEVRDRVYQALKSGDSNPDMLSDINILDILRKNGLSSPEKIGALERVSLRLQQNRNPPCYSEKEWGTRGISYGFVWTQIYALDNLIRELSEGKLPPSSSVSRMPESVKHRIVTEARAVMSELHATLEALDPHD